MATSLQDLLNSNVADVTDFPPETDAPGLRALDRALRCDICSELYDAPMTLACGHCFCSMCAREALREKSVCPACRAPATETGLRKNASVEEAVRAWQAARAFVLRLVREEVEARSRADDDARDERQRKKRKRNGETQGTPVMSPNKTTGRPKIRRSKSSEHHRKEEEEEEIPPEQIPTSDAEEAEIQENSIVDCPACNRRIRLDKINRHLDQMCPTPSPPDASGAGPSKKAKNKEAWSFLGNVPSPKAPNSTKGKGKEKDDPIPAEDAERLPRASYAVLKDKKLREMLHTHNLPTTGDRTMLISRHERYVMLYNANLDKSPGYRKSEAELRADLQKWEESRTVKKVVVDDSNAYQKVHKESFAYHVAAARKTKVKHPGKDDTNGVSTPPDAEESGAIAVGGAPSTPSANGRTPRPAKAIVNETVVLDSEDET